MDESAHSTNNANNANNNKSSSLQQLSSQTTKKQPIMITDALTDVRQDYAIDPKELGHGHYGVVRKCKDRKTGQLYAIKSIRKSKVNKIEVLKREITILERVKHPHIIELVQVYEDERYLHLVTELCTGGELFDRIIDKTQSDEGRFAERAAAQLVLDILDAIRYCHDDVGIVHRDLKPENFLFKDPADDAAIKIIDFGLSRHDDTAQGIMQTKVGTPYYVAPEVLRREYTNSCDIWSIGVITYILLCGYPPFYGDNDTQIFESVRVGKFDFPSPEWDDISDSAKKFVTQLLHKQPHLRPTAAQALQHDWLSEQLGPEATAKARAACSGGNSSTNLDGSTSKNATIPEGEEYDENAENYNSNNTTTATATNTTTTKTPAPRTNSRIQMSNETRTGRFVNYLATKKLKKAALGYIATHLTHAEVSTLEKLFRSIDTESKGIITLQQVDQAIAAGDFPEATLTSVQQLRRDLALADETVLNYRDFCASTMDRSLAMREDNMKKALIHFKQTEQKELTVADLAKIFGGENHAKEIMEILDADGDGKVSFDDFRRALVEMMNHDEIPDDC